MKKLIFLFLSIIFYVIAIFIIGVKPIHIVNKNFFWGNSFYSYILSVISSIISFTLLMKYNDIEKDIVKLFLLFFMIYFALVIGANFVFDLVVKILINYYKNNTMIDTPEYEQLWRAWSNDLSRTFLYFFGLFYSFIATSLYFMIINIIKRRKK